MSDTINQENKAIWEANADYWDARMGIKGNDWHSTLISPITVRLLNMKPGDKLLDVGCGNGVFARTMAHLGVNVTAFDFAERNILNAKTYPSEHIDYKVLDATKSDELLSLGNHTYDAAAANMVLMDIPIVDPLFKALTQLLKPGGSFVFSIPHPCFRGEKNVREDDDGIFVFDYTENIQSMGEAIRNQPELQFYFHRSISTLLHTAFKYGLIMDGIEEPVFEKKKQTIFTKIPPVLILRLRYPES
ncbi:MAG: class I SAM-dependent methyltransferase [Bacteroidia bacterium]